MSDALDPPPQRINGLAACGEVLLVGEANPYGADPRYALYYDPERSAGGRLCRLVCELRPSTYLAIHRANLCPSDWSTREAHRRALLIAGAQTPSTPWRVIVMLGRKVHDAFAHGTGLHLEPFARSVHEPSGLTFLALPHPSGLNRRAWNVPGAYERARAALREVAPAIPWGEAPAPHKIKLPPTEPHDAGGFRQ